MLTFCISKCYLLYISPFQTGDEAIFMLNLSGYSLLSANTHYSGYTDCLVKEMPHVGKALKYTFMRMNYSNVII